ncbi:MAG TPA: LamG-like jellyroll fold domain-containing protein [Lacunisphaera sp.]|nr:LamG-like jellyroll fold domain-containing protein [Lacunisphaera sp.]
MSRLAVVAAICAAVCTATLPAAESGLLFHLSADHGTTADYSAAGTPAPTFDAEVTTIPDGAKGPALSCGDLQRLAWRASGNIYAQRGTLSFFWRSRYPVGPTAFPIFRVGYADHSSWDMTWLRIDYNGQGFDAFVTDANLARTRVSVTLPEFPGPKTWTHLALAWDETRGIRFYVNGRLAAKQETTAVYDAALDQFGPHSRVISPWQVQSDYNFVRGGDIDEIRIYDRMVDDAAIVALARGEAAPAAALARQDRTLQDPATRAEWLHRYGWDRELPPPLPAGATNVRKVEIHDAYDLKRWWWKACDGIRETTWPGVYNRSRLPGRNDYFQLPDWDCYSLSGKAVTFALPDEPWNHVEITGAAWGRMELLTSDTPLENAGDAPGGRPLFVRAQGSEKTVHVMSDAITGGRMRFSNQEQEEPISEISVYYVTAGHEPSGSAQLEYRLSVDPIPGEPTVKAVEGFIAGRYPPDERHELYAQSADEPLALYSFAPPAGMPLVHVLVPDTWDQRADGLDGIALDLHPLAPHESKLALNLRVHDPLWPARDLCDFSFSMNGSERHTLWLDLRDRLLPPGKALWLTLAASSPLDLAALHGAKLRLVFKPRAAALAEHVADRFTQARDAYAMLVEEHPHSEKYDLWNRFKGDLEDLLRVDPENVLGRQYAAVALGAPRPPFVQPDPPAGVPLWAFRQVTQLGLVEKFVTWYIDHRQIDDGEFGGGISDDTDLTNMWPGVALMGCAPDKLAASVARLLDAAYANGMFTRGLPTIQTDELHSYEEGINCLGQNLILNYGSPRQLERAMETARGFAGLTGINAAGHRHIRTSYFSGIKMATEDPWGVAKSYSYLVAQPDLLLGDFNGNPAARQMVVELAEGLLAHKHPDKFGSAALPSAIRFADDSEGVATRGNLPWPIFWGAWRFTGRREFLEPILDGGPAALNAVNANALDWLGLRAEWRDRILEGARGRPVDYRRVPVVGRPRESSYRGTVDAPVRWQLTGDKRILAQLYGEQNEETKLQEFINTEGSLWIDRVGVPYAELQRARLGGIALTRGATYPGHTVSWRFAAPATAESVAILIPNATTTSFKVIAYNLETTPVHATMTGWNIDPGRWEITQGLDMNDDDEADREITTHEASFERTKSVDITFAPRATTVLTFRLKTSGTPYWSRPDLGLDAQDVQIASNELHVTIHGLGSVPSPESEVVLRDATGAVRARATLGPLAAPVDLQPRTTTVTLKLPAGLDPRGDTIEIDPDHRLEEITRLNNVVRL